MNTWHQKGFTMIELMITLLVAALVLGVGVPNFQQFLANNRMATATNDVVTALHAARSQAVKRRGNVSICPSANWNAPNPTCSPLGQLGDGHIVFADCSAANPCGAPNLAVDGFDVVLRVRGPLPQGVAPLVTTDAAGPEYFSFGPTGFPRTAAGFPAPIANLQLCDDRGNHNTGNNIAAGRWLQVTPTGRPQVYRDIAYVQGAQNPLGGC
ncbi:MAG: GspH/FimT family pseudopilin [Chromatiales bacterium]|nr:MAG: GspH/FimT family pseudopilin [Chromatiales bacterium]